MVLMQTVISTPPMKGLLDWEGWKHFKKIADQEKHFLCTSFDIKLLAFMRKSSGSTKKLQHQVGRHSNT
jgi:hypothetical protein